MTLPSLPYEQFLRNKAIVANPLGIEIDPDSLHPCLKHHQREMVLWMCRMGRAACFASFGLGKTVIQLETVRQVRHYAGGMGLIVAPLGVRGEFMRDAAMLGIELKFIRTIEEAEDSSGIYITNYETIRDGKLDPRAFTVSSLDEAAVLRGFGSTLTFREFMRVFDGIRYKFIATATPSPNEYIELLAYSAYLEVMEVGEGKTRFFKRDSTKADKLTLHAHKEREFWLWVSSWALFVQTPSDIGGDDTGYALPELRVHWHEIPAEHTGGQQDEHGQSLLFDAQAMGLQGAAREKRESLGKRVDKLAELINNELRKSANFRGFGNALQRSSGSERIPESLLSEASSGCFAKTEGIDCGNDGGGEGQAQGVYARVSTEIPSREQRKEIGSGKGELSRKYGSVQEEVSGVEAEQSGSLQGSTEKLFDEKLGQDQGKKRSLVQGEQEQGVSDSKSQQAETLRNLGGGVSEDTGKTGICLRDLQGTSCAGNITQDSESGSLPRNRGSKGSPLQQVQHGTRSARRHTCENHVSSGLSDQVVVWCDLNSEQDAITRRLAEEGISSSSLYGSQPIDDREELMNAWRDKRTSAFISKPRMYGSGVNMQQCHTMVFVGINYKASDFLQAIHRIHRFQQSHDCDVHIIYTENERQVRQILERKWAQHITLTRNMSGIIKEFGLDNLRRAEAMSRALGVEREEVKTDHFHVIHNDTVLETRSMLANSVGLILTSIPFSTQYEYSPNYADFGHSDSNEHFFEQMDYLTPELLRVLKPGRMAVIHVKDRIVPGGMTGLGFQTVYPFHARCIDHYTRHGFGYMGMKTIVTDVVRENNQTYRLGWTEQCKDGTKMGVGMPEYLLLFRKPQSDTSRSYTDDPVTKPKPLVFATDEDRKQPWEQRKRAAFKASDKRPCVRGTGYSRARWQIDAHGFARSSGDRFPTTEEIRNMPHAAIFKAFRKWGLENIYEYEQHVGIGEDMEEDARLPVSFMLLQPPSWHPDVWTDIARMRCLNGEQKHKGKTMHLCLARDSRVLTKDHGYIPIQEVSCLDQVLTHKGRWRPVLQVKNTGIQPVITVKAQGVPGLTLTPDHNLWTRKSDWARSRDGAERAEPTWIEAQHTLSAYLNQKTPPVEFTDAGDETLWWTVGRWLADGHIDSHGGTILSIGRDKWDEFVSKAGRFVVNTPYEGTALQVLLTDPQRELRNILDHCGSGAGNKHLPPEAFVLPFEQARALIEGYLSGDGHFIPERNSWQASSISRDLLLGLSILVQRVYQAIPSIFAGRPDREHVIEGRTVQARQEWGMAFSINDSRKRPFILDDGAWKKVSSLTDAGEAETWCLKVEEDESFTAEGCVVKNCPMQFDIADRVINQMSDPGDIVFDPFGGLMTVPYRAIKHGRYGMGVELATGYYQDGLFYCQQAVQERQMPSLFDFLDAEEDQLEYSLEEAA